MSKFFYTDKPIVGLDISTTGIKLMSIDPKKWVVEGYGSIDLDPLKTKEAFEDSESTFLTDNLKALMTDQLNGTLKGTSVAIAVPTARSFTRTFTLPAAAEKNLDEAIILEAEQYIPIPVSTLLSIIRLLNALEKRSSFL